jgi:NAD(P)-dependent dehydrogenase (short-subunit alcohol dehydrogenase family)
VVQLRVKARRRRYYDLAFAAIANLSVSEEESMARALVIGGTLFIGRALVDQLLARGDDIVVMHRGKGTPFDARVGEIQCDRNDVAAVRAALAAAHSTSSMTTSTTGSTEPAPIR